MSINKGLCTIKRKKQLGLPEQARCDSGQGKLLCEKKPGADPDPEGQRSSALTGWGEKEILLSCRSYRIRFWEGQSSHYGHGHAEVNVTSTPDN